MPAAQRVRTGQLAPAISAYLPAADIDTLEAALYGPDAAPCLWSHLAAPIRACLRGNEPASAVPEFPVLLKEGVDVAALAALSDEQRALLRPLALELPARSRLLAQLLDDAGAEQCLREALASCDALLASPQQGAHRDALEAQLRRLERAIAAVRSASGVLPSQALYWLNTGLKQLRLTSLMATSDSPVQQRLAAMQLAMVRDVFPRLMRQET